MLDCCISCRMDGTMLSDKGERELNEVQDLINIEREKDNKLNVTYKVNAHLAEMRTSDPACSY